MRDMSRRLMLFTGCKMKQLACGLRCSGH